MKKEEISYDQKRQVVLKYINKIEVQTDVWYKSCINIQFKDKKLYKYTFYHNKKGDYCVLNEKGSIINFELLNNWKSNTLNFKLKRLDEMRNKNK